VDETADNGAMVNVRRRKGNDAVAAGLRTHHARSETRREVCLPNHSVLFRSAQWGRTRLAVRDPLPYMPLTFPLGGMPRSLPSVAACPLDTTESPAIMRHVTIPQRISLR